MYFKLVTLLFLVDLTIGYNLLPTPQIGWKLRNKNIKVLKEEDENLINLSTREIGNSLSFSESAVERLRTLEHNLHRSKIGTNENDLQLEDALKITKNALVIQKATIQLMNTQCHRNNLPVQKCAQEVGKYDVEPFMEEICTRIQINCTNVSLLIRSISGECNHLTDGAIGKSLTPYKRFLYPAYQDGVYRPRGTKKQGPPSPRLITKKLMSTDDDDDDNEVMENITLALMQWGQYIDHDLAQTVSNKMIHNGNTIRCCSWDGLKLAPRYVHPFCHAIDVPEDDEFYAKKDIKCLNYVRSMGGIRNDCTLGPLDQLNHATHYLDGSQIYGSTPETSSRLRSGVKGKLKMFNDKYPDVNSKSTEYCRMHNCFETGDSRLNLHPQLAAMHIIWIREHNRIADQISALHPKMSDEDLFEETRKFVIAEIQHITYNEWLPLIVDVREMKRITSGPKVSYDQVDPSISNSFASAAFRFLVSLIPQNFTLYDEERNLSGILKLGQHFHNPRVLLESASFDGLLRGLTVQPSPKVDLSYAQDVMDVVYNDGSLGIDMVSLDIQRGRDHGLPSYNQFRQLCGLKSAKIFEDFLDCIPQTIVERLREVYRSPEDVDLLVGGIAEIPRKGSRNILGPTFTCIIVDQFERTRRGDRYFYDLNSDLFTEEKLKEVRKISLAKVICDNADGIKKMQPNAFLPLSESNPLTSCDDLPSIDWSLLTY